MRNRFIFQASERPARFKVYNVVDMINFSSLDTGEAFPDHISQDLDAIKRFRFLQGGGSAERSDFA